MAISLITWWLVVQILGVIALPITAFLFGRLSLKGYAFSKTVGLLLVGYGSWLLAMFGLAHFDFVGIVLTTLIVSAGGLQTLRRSGLHDLVTIIRTRWPAVLAYELFFIMALLGGLWLRWHGATGAAVVGTEKPMELAFLSGILQSSTFPPQDPWLAGYAINYYYLGYVFVAMLAALSHVSVGEAFNLGLATIFALTALMIVGLVVALIEQTKEKAHSRWDTVGIGTAAVLGVVFVLILGNQTGALQVLLKTPQVVVLDGPQLVSAVEQRLRGQSPIQIEPPIATSDHDFGTLTELAPDPSASFNWWWPSRAVWDDFEVSPGRIERHYAITEFPFFSFYLGDLHPHVLALPFSLLALTLALATLIQPPLPDAHGRLYIVVTALVLGSLYMINSWDAPTYVLIFAGALVLGYRRQFDQQNTAQILRHALPVLVAVALVAGVVLLPFLVTFSSFAGGNPAPEPWSKLPLLRLLAQILLPVPDHTALHEFISIFGLFILILLVYAGRTRPTWPETNPAHKSTVWTIFDKFAWGWTAGTLILGLLIDMPLLALLPLALVCWRTAWQCPDQPARAFVLWAAAAGALVVFGADVVYLRDPFENRMNTIFKFYYQAWVIWGTMAAYGVWVLGRQGPAATSIYGRLGHSGSPAGSWRIGLPGGDASLGATVDGRTIHVRWSGLFAGVSPG